MKTLKKLTGRIMILSLCFAFSLPLAAQLGGTSMHHPIYNPAPSSGGSVSRDFIPASPSAASLGQFGSIPVGHFTGTTQISLPIHTFQEKELSVPIGIFYDQAGNKPENLPGTLGIGWTLQAGGSITRIVNGAPDLYPYYPWEEDDYYYQNPQGPPIYYPAPLLMEDFRYQGWDHDNWYDIRNYMQYDGNWPIYFPYALYPDKYIFNFNGHKGVFYALNDSVFKVQSRDGEYFSVQIHTWKQYEEDFLEFILTDSRGVQYRFGGEYCTEYSQCGIQYEKKYRKNEVRVPISWHLESIKSPSDAFIFFSYEPYTTVVKTRYTDYAVYSQCLSELTCQERLTYLTPGAKELNNQIWYKIEGLALSYIYGNSSTVVFDYSDSNQLPYPSISYADSQQAWIYEGIRNKNPATARLDANAPFPPKLDKIQILYPASGLSTVLFSYRENNESRLRLSYVSQGSPAAGYIRLYDFRYNSTSLPAYHSEQTDLYGFYNNKNSFNDKEENNLLKMTGNLRGTKGYLLKERTDQLQFFLDSVKAPDPVYAQAELLTEIVYPTGGSSRFTYEPHTYGRRYTTWPFEIHENPNGAESVTAGVRIQRIANYDHTGVLLNEKRFHYKKDFHSGGSLSSGVLSYTPRYIEHSTHDLNKIYGISGQYVFARVTSNPGHGFVAKGPHVTYSEVTVEEPGNGFTTYKYKNYDNGYMDKDMLAYYDSERGQTDVRDFSGDPGISMELERGQVLSEEVYNNQRSLQQKTEYKYNDSPSRFDDNVRYLFHKQNSFHVMGFPSYRMAAGVIYTYFPYLREKAVTSYHARGNHVLKESYSYNETYRLLKSVETANSLHTETYRMEIDYTLDQNQSLSVVARMKELQMLNYPFESRVKTYDNKMTKSITGYSLYIRGIQSIPLLQKKSIQYPDGSQVTDMLVAYYDIQNNPFFITDRSGNSGCFIWSYKHAKLLMKIEGVTYSELKNLLGETNLNKLYNNSLAKDEERIAILTGLRNNSGLNHAFITYYEYNDRHLLTAETDARGITTYYTYDGFDRLKEVYVMEGSAKRVIENYDYNYKR